MIDVPVRRTRSSTARRVALNSELDIALSSYTAFTRAGRQVIANFLPEAAQSRR